MASPLSVGDCILLSQLAYKLGSTLTRGRKNAPDTFKEVQRQLNDLGKALSIIGTLGRKDSTRQNEESIAETPISRTNQEDSFQDEHFAVMISNCENTLKRMETLCDKYKVLDESVEDPMANGKSKGDRFREDVKKQWKKVRWTMEDEELSSIQKDLTVHMDALKLAILGMNNLQSQQIGKGVGYLNVMVRDMHTWFTRNLKDAKFMEHYDLHPLSSRDNSEPASELTFELHANLRTGPGHTLLCPKASFRGGWLDNDQKTGGAVLFKCNCVQQGEKEVHEEQLHYNLVDTSLVVRLAGSQRTWQMFCSSGRATSLILKRVAPSKLSRMQLQVDLLAKKMGQASLKSGKSSMLIYHSLTGAGEKFVSLLDSKSETSQFRGQIIRSTFIKSDRSFTQSSIDSVHILHYRSLLSGQATDSKVTEQSSLVHQDHGELVLQPLGNSPTARIMVDVKYNTELFISEDNRILNVSDVNCTAETASGDLNRITGASVKFEFITAQAAITFLSAVEGMKRELYHYYLQFPQLEERIVFQCLCGNTQINEFFLADAQVTLLFDPRTQSHRMILLNGAHSACMSMQLPPEFFETLDGRRSSRVDLKYPAHFVEHHSDDVTYVTEEITDISGLFSKQLRL